MLARNFIIRVPKDETKLVRKYDDVFKKEDNYFMKYNPKTHEVFIIHAWDKRFVPDELIQIKEIVGVAMGQYKSKNGKFYKNINVYVNYEHYKYNNQKHITRYNVGEEIIMQKCAYDESGTLEYLDPDLLDF